MAPLVASLGSEMGSDSMPELTDWTSSFELSLGQEPKELSLDNAIITAVLVDLWMTTLLMCCEKTRRIEMEALPGKNVVKPMTPEFGQRCEGSSTCTLRKHGECMGAGLCR